MNKAHELVAAYAQWLKQNITAREVDGWVELTTPFLDRHNDHLQIYVKMNGNDLLLTDDGYILADLAMSGCDVASPKRQELLHGILNGYGVQLHQEALTIQATLSTFPQRKHMLVQAMLTVNDLFMTTRPVVQSLFLDEVEQFMDSHHIRYVPALQMTGRSGLAHRFDYVIPAWKQAPERIVEAVNNPTRPKVQSLLYAWNDVRELRKRPIAMYAMINDSERPIPKVLVDACSVSGVQVVPWSEREDHLASLIA